MKLWLLIRDDDLDQFYLHCVFDDTEHDREAINRIVDTGISYKLIKGDLIEHSLGEDRWENVPF